jgi:hypothetical protein
MRILSKAAGNFFREAESVSLPARRDSPRRVPLSDLPAHQPGRAEARPSGLSAGCATALTLSGHTHGGQLMLNAETGFGPLMFRY